VLLSLIKVLHFSSGSHSYHFTMSSSKERYAETRKLIADVNSCGHHEAYVLLENGTPSIEEYRDLRAVAGLSLKTVEQAERALQGSWYSVVVKSKDSGTVVGMGRIVGDGGWYFHIVDMAVHPDHQRKGLGDAIMAELMRRILDEAPQGPYVNLVADEAGRPLYKKWGFAETAPRSVGMERRFDGPRPN
jgi:ribosomal protein S18 acetylase RimI-like enzyme